VSYSATGCNWNLSSGLAGNAARSYTNILPSDEIVQAIVVVFRASSFDAVFGSAMRSVYTAFTLFKWPISSAIIVGGDCGSSDTW